MSDGRAFTDYRPRCAVNAELMGMVSNAKMTQSSYESRMFLQQNAEKVMNMNRNNALKDLAPCAPCPRPFTEDGTMLPARYVVRCDGVSCTRTEVNPNGLGDARNYA
jgi:hypothetical protein